MPPSADDGLGERLDAARERVDRDREALRALRRARVERQARADVVAAAVRRATARQRRRGGGGGGPPGGPGLASPPG